MKIYRSFEEFSPVPNAVVTQGTFDGVHIGHKKIISRLRDLAEKNSGETVLITFFPHPRLVLYPDDNNLKLINTLDEKIELLRAEGIDHLLIIPFTREFSRLSSLQFIRDYIVNCIGTRVLVIGYDHRFGKNREGTFIHLKEFSSMYGFKVEEIPEQDVDHVAISSTKIRNALLEGDIHTANKYLGRNFSLQGIVVKGRQLGREIGFPTANIKVEESYKLIPADGVYAVNVQLMDRKFKGMLNAGMKPTFDGLDYSIEVHIFDFDEDIYGQGIKVDFVDKIRDEQRFESVAHLKKQLENDKFEALRINP